MAGLYFSVGADFDKLKQLEQDINRLKSTLKGMDSAADKKAFDALNRQLQQVQREYDTLAGKISRYVTEQNKASQATASSTNEMLNLFAKIGGTTAFIALGKQVMDVRNEFQQLEIAFGTMLKSTDKAASLMKDLTKFAAETPFGLQSAASGAKQLLAYGSTADTVIKELTMLGDVAAGTGQQIGDLVYLYGTLRTQGRAYLMDIRQFAGRGIPIYDELAKVLNTSKDKVNEFVSAGKVGFKEVEQAFKNMTAQGGLYGGLMEEQSKSIGGRMEALKDNISSIFNQIGKDSEGLIYKSIDGINTLVENYDKVGRALLELVAIYGAYRAALIITVALQNVGNIQAYASAFIETARSLGIATAAQTAFNTSVKANPYALAAAAIVALGYGIYKLATYQTEAEEAQNRLNDAFKESQKGVISETRELSILKGELSATKKGTEEYKKIKDQIVSKYGQYYAGLEGEIERVGLLDSTYKKLTESIMKSFGARQYDKFIKNEFDNLDNVLNENLSKIQDRIYGKFDDKEVAAKYFANIRSALIEGRNLDKSSISVLDYVQDKGTVSADSRVDNYIKNIREAQKVTEEIDKKAKERFGIEDGKYNSKSTEDATKSIKSLTIQTDEARKKVSDLKKELADLQSGRNLTENQSKAIEEKIKEIKDAEDSLSYLVSGKSASSQSKENKSTESAADKAKKLQQELKALQAKLSNEQIRQQIESEQKLIDRQEDGFNKQFEQNKLNYKKELQQIKEFEDEKAKERSEAILKFGKDKVPENLSEANIKVQVDTMKNDALLSFDKANSDTLKNLTDKYQSYADQRIEIEKKFNKDIDALIKLRDKAQEKGDKESVDKLNRSIAKATADKGKDLISFDFERMKEAPEYIRAFEDLGTTSSETLNSLLGQFEKYKEEAAKVLSPKELREYTTTIQSIADELSSRDLYGSLIKQKDEAVKANQRLIKAENDLRLVQLGIGDPSLTEEEAIKRVNKAKDEYYNKNKKVLDTQKKIRDQVSALAKEMSGLGNALGGTSGEIISFIGDITSFYTTASEGIEKVAQTGAQAISVVEKASVILTIISTAIQLMKELNSILPDAFSQYEKYDEKIERINDMRDAVNEYEIAVLKANQAENSWFGNDSLRNLKDYKELQTKIFDSYRDKMLEEQAIYENKGSGGWLTNSLKSAVGWVSKITFGFDLLNKKYKEGTTAAVNNLRIETRKKSSGFLGSGIGGKSQKTEDLQTWINKNKDLFKGLDTQLFGSDGMLNQELAGVILEKYGDKLVGQTKETLEELKTLTEQYNEFRAQLREYVSSLYEPLVDNMVDSIWDWFDEGKDALDSFRDYAKETFRDIVSDMIKTILLKDVFKDFKDNIAKLYEEYSKGNLTEAQLSEAVAKETNSVMDRYKTQLPAIQGMVDTINKNLKDATGIDLNKSTSYSQSSSKGSFETITQDQAGEMNGRLSGILETNIRSEGYLKSISEWNKPISEKIDMSSILLPLNLIKESSTKIEQMIEENKSIAIHSYYELRDINKNTKELYQIREDIASLRKDGIKVK